jgi:hypothetical protein
LRVHCACAQWQSTTQVCTSLCMARVTWSPALCSANAPVHAWVNALRRTVPEITTTLPRVHRSAAYVCMHACVRLCIRKCVYVRMCVSVSVYVRVCGLLCRCASLPRHQHRPHGRQPQDASRPLLRAAAQPLERGGGVRAHGRSGHHVDPHLTTPVVKMLCHRGPVNALAYDTTGHYMVTAGGDWDCWSWHRACGQGTV